MPRSGMARWKGSCVRKLITYCPIPSMFVVVFCPPTSRLPISPRPPQWDACVRVKSLQLCPTLCDPMDCSLPGSSVHGILQARIVEWVTMPSSRGSSRRKDQTCLSYISWVGRQFLYQEWHLESAPHPSGIHDVKHLDLVQSVGKKWWSWCSFNVHFFYCKWERTSLHYMLNPIICHLCFITFWEASFSLFKV